MTQPPKHNGEEFFANTHYEQMARRPGGVPRDKALAAARHHIDELKSGFIDWLNERLNELAAALAALDAEPSLPAHIESAYRISGEVRDVGTTLGYGTVTFVATTLCELLEAIKAGATYDKEMIDCHVNALNYVVRQRGNLTDEQAAELTAGLRRIAGIASISPGRDTE